MEDSLEKLKQEAEQVYAEAERLYSAAEVEAAIDNMARAITTELKDKNPVVLCLMIGAVIIVGKLLPRLNFPLQLEYVHATRYQGTTTGGNMQWVRSPSVSLQGRTVLIVDDVLDEGVTMTTMIEECKKAGAVEIRTAVLADKQIKKSRPLKQADFTGLSIPDYYVFGYGMDYKSYLRNAPGIYAVKTK
ncbi:MAG: hypoxanthine-guanine phosphoribosyltransferase [Gammaproteobacteria bacterium]